MSAPATVRGTHALVDDRTVVAGPTSDPSNHAKIDWPSLLAKLGPVLAGLLALARLRALIPTRVLRVFASLIMLGVVIILMVAARLLPSGVLLRFAQRLC